MDENAKEQETRFCPFYNGIYCSSACKLAMTAEDGDGKFECAFVVLAASVNGLLSMNMQQAQANAQMMRQAFMRQTGNGQGLVL